MVYLKCLDVYDYPYLKVIRVFDFPTEESQEGHIVVKIDKDRVIGILIPGRVFKNTNIPLKFLTKNDAIYIPDKEFVKRR